MREIDLNKIEEIYPYIYIPEIIKNHINDGYNKSEKLDYLNIKKPVKENNPKLCENLPYYFTNSPQPIKIDNILELEYDSINEDLENYTFCLGEYPLPKKPILYHVEKQEKIDFETSFANILHTLILLPIFGFGLYFIFAVFGPLFITFEERREMSVWPFLIIGSSSLYLILLAYAVFHKDSEVFTKYIKVKRSILEESVRINLLDQYKQKVKEIEETFNKNYKKELIDFEITYAQNSQLAEMGILKNKLSENPIPLIDNRNFKKGKSELHFLEYLYKNFGRNVFTDYSPDIGKNPFQPDFIVFDCEINFYLDIEIDEPYSLLDGTTIHHDRTKDEERNRFFNGINWGVIRFTERQVMQKPDECCYIISSVLEAIKNRNTVIKHNLEIENFWTHEEALIMKMKDYRNSY
ncbi:hypothetical protein RM545_17060 [Zunongwangia sp. F260]|uniref:DUF559 domain-containing protein n=1 Tax=Autumnicola lenta TaxID=3075593 RepID=A0ABU3CPX0_9FLAO|nr:hypothetical protein [Zunongwangia sp. F260]MDT0648404.1 hypothetical protein [Zunongwangia sp. F260]